MTPNRQGIVAVIPWASTGLAQLYVGGTLASYVGRLWALRLSIVLMCIGVYVPPYQSRDLQLRNMLTSQQDCSGRAKYLRYPSLWPPADRAWLWVCLHCIESLRCRMCPSQTPWQLCRHSLPIRVPTGYFDRFLGGLWHDVLREAIQHCLESLEHHSNPYWPHICRSLFLLPRKVRFPTMSLLSNCY